MFCFKDDTSGSTVEEVGFDHIAGVFIVLLVGLGVACIIAVCEFALKSRKERVV